MAACEVKIAGGYITSILIRTNLSQMLRVHLEIFCVCQQAMPMVAGNKSSKWDACRLKAIRLEYCLRDNNYRPIDCVPEILDLKQCCQLHEVLLPLSHGDANEKALVHFGLSATGSACASCS